MNGLPGCIGGLDVEFLAWLDTPLVLFIGPIEKASPRLVTQLHRYRVLLHSRQQGSKFFFSLFIFKSAGELFTETDITTRIY